MSKLPDSCNFLGIPPPPKKGTRIKIGDVGFVRRRKFHLLLGSAGSPLGDRKLGDDVLTTFEPLNIRALDDGLSRQPDCLCTDTVQKFGADVTAGASAGLYTPFPQLLFNILKYLSFRPIEPGASFSFELTEDHGAALVMKFLTHTRDAMADGAFGEYTERHYKSWVEFARKKRYGKDVQPVLISGFDVTGGKGVFTQGVLLNRN